MNDELLQALASLAVALLISLIARFAERWISDAKPSGLVADFVRGTLRGLAEAA